MAMNREWHAAHQLPRNATLDERIRWHIEHTASCGCRQMPAAIKRELEAWGVAIASPPARGS
jgi:hypothetical protein